MAKNIDKGRITEEDLTPIFKNPNEPLDKWIIRKTIEAQGKACPNCGVVCEINAHECPECPWEFGISN